MTTRSFQFFRAGGFEQVRFESGADLMAIDQLDWKLWVALACPTKGLAFDSRTLELIDLDGDGRIRAPELIGAVKWAGGLLKSPDDFLKGPAELPLSAIRLDVEEGKQVHSAAKTVLRGLGKADAATISVADSAAAVKAFHAMAFNGDGVIPAESASTDAQRALIADVAATIGSSDDKSGKKGVTADQVKAFFAALDEYLAWLKKGEGDAALMPLKGDTVAAFEAMKIVRAKVDDYFARCRLAAFDARAAAALNREEKEYLAVAAKDLSITADEIKGFPLAHIEANRALPLTSGVNPAWADAVAAFAAKTVKPLVGGDGATLTDAQWLDIRAKLAAYEAWQGSKPGAAVEKLGVERLKAVQAERASLDVLFENEKAQEPTANSIASVERLVRYARDLFQLANNFVSFKDFYERKKPAIFQVGRLFLDQRECELVLRVEDAGKHATMAPLSRGYLAYCDVTRPASGEKMSVVGVMSAGDSDNLMVGRNGLFKDREGRDWDATVTRIVDNPISIRQAFWSPYKKALRFIEEQFAKRAAEEEKASNALLTDSATAAGKAATDPKAEKPAPKKLDIGVVAAIGVAVGGITAALGALLQSFFGLGMWMPLGLLGLLLLISGPSMLIAWLKLRQRNLGPLLDANGWAVNANAMMNVPFGGSLTSVAKLPPGSRLDLQDPFAEKRRPWGLYLTLIVIAALGIAWTLGKLDGLLPPAARSVEVLGDFAPAKVVKPEVVKTEAASPAAPPAPAAAAPGAPAPSAPPAAAPAPAVAPAVPAPAPAQ